MRSHLQTLLGQGPHNLHFEPSDGGIGGAPEVKHCRDSFLLACLAYMKRLNWRTLDLSPACTPYPKHLKHAGHCNLPRLIVVFSECFEPVFSEQSLDPSVRHWISFKKSALNGRYDYCHSHSTLSDTRSSALVTVFLAQKTTGSLIMRRRPSQLLRPVANGC